jgi:predicted nucleotide-binding protein
MSEDYRRQAIRAIAIYFLTLSERDADKVLSDVDLPPTPEGWGGRPDPARSADIRLALSTAPASALERLLLFADIDLDRPIGAQDAPEPSATTSTAPPSHELSAATTSLAVDESGPIFLVHGHSRAILYETVRVVERATGREVVVLREQPNAGRTILEKFEKHAAGAAYAVVLLTADDEGGPTSGADRRPRGRQNVIFELGFFFGKLGRDRVAVLLDEGVEEPSDINGLTYISLDSGGAWKQSLARELASANIDVDYARIP